MQCKYSLPNWYKNKTSTYNKQLHFYTKVLKARSFPPSFKNKYVFQILEEFKPKYVAGELESEYTYVSNLVSIFA